MAQPTVRKGRSKQELFNDYGGFVDKFKPKKTTDDCYTPDYIYNAFVQWLNDKGYITPDTPLVRPFWPGADCTDLTQYAAEGCVVVDNPPFSMLAQIIRFYDQHNITYFLFAPSLTVFNYATNRYNATAIILDFSCIYENGAVVNTAFLTNHPDLAPFQLITAPDLYTSLKQAQKNHIKEVHKKLPKYAYTDNVVSAARIHKIAHFCPFMLPRASASFVRTLDAQRPIGKTIYGGGLLISNDKAAELKAAELKAAELKAAYTFQLSEREQQIVNNLI